MPDERRHHDPDEGRSGTLDRLPHHVLYPILGLLLSFLAPLSAFLLRLWQSDPVIKWLWIRSELDYNALFYLFMGISMAATLAVFGYIVGKRSESQRAHNKALAQRARELQLRSVTDGLTGAYSHAYLQEMLSIEIERAQRHARPLSVLIMDIDDFKKINDTHGHLFGDQVLEELTETINMNIREEDVLGRYGGEEFLVIMPGADAAAALKVGERVCRAVARAAIIDKRGEPGGSRVQVTLSVGVSTFSGQGEITPYHLIDTADKHLYRAKKEGKNRVCA
jgi:diguanylate cyclase (GGDEF)-like protein